MSDAMPMKERSPILRALAGKPIRRPAAKAILAASTLPPPVKELIAEVVRRVGGWRSERADVAAELVAHFGDAVAAGQSPEAAIAGFGDPRQAAALLRRAVRRKRGVLWKAWWWSSRGAAAALAAVLAVFGFLSLRFWFGHPTITFDPISRLHALTPDVPPSEQAWPLLREAIPPLKALERQYAEEAARTNAARIPIEAVDPADPGWARAEADLRAQSEALATLRSAAATPALGFRLGAFAPEDAVILDGGGAPTFTTDPIWRDAVVFLSLPYLAELRRGARWLVADARHAAAQGDGSRTAASLEAAFGLGRLALDRPFVVDQLVGQAILAAAANAVSSLVAERSDAFGEADLARLAAVMDSLPDERLRIRYDAERIGFEDLLQRLYTDDGNGDGRLIASALGPADARPGQGIGGTESDLLRTAAPAMALWAPSRREALRRFEAETSEAEALRATYPWTWSPQAWKRAMGGDRPAQIGPAWSVLDSLGGWIRPGPALRSMVSTRLRLDVAAMSVALIRYRQRHGRWPASAGELVPEFLERLPLDPYDGRPLRYLLEGGQPSLWTVGPDCIDDAGQKRMSEAYEAGAAHQWIPPDERSPRPPMDGMLGGDVPLWPPSLIREAPVRPGEALLIGR